MNPTLFICTECGNDYCTNARTNRTCIICGGFKAKSKPITNADHIRAMTDEDLAAYLGHASLCVTIQGEDGGAWCSQYGDCNECVLDWLRQEVSNG